MATDLLIQNNDRLQEISMKLEQSHLVYLQTDDSPLKLQQRQKLEGFIQEYLCLVPNEAKYIFHDTIDILHRSAATLKDFSGYRAATAWSTIALYAANLLAQPWRKEYRTLRTYSGYYKHEVEANLIGAEQMFEQMGYKHTGLGMLTLEGPIDPDRVSAVSRDAIVAFVECQIIKQIWESVSKNFAISWLEVLEFREKHVGTAEQAIRALNYRFFEKLQHQDNNKVDNYRDYRIPALTSMDGEPSAMSCHMPMNQYAVPNVPLVRPDYRYIEETGVHPAYHYYQRFGPNVMNPGLPYGCTSSANKLIVGYHPISYSASTPGYAARVPIGRLIELDSTPSTATGQDKSSRYRKSSQRTSNVDEVDFNQKKQSSDSDFYDYSKTNKKLIKPEKGKLESWDYVYKNLESLGYSKDLGDREDILCKKGTQKLKSSDSHDNGFVSNGLAKQLKPLKNKSSSFEFSDSGKSNGFTESEDKKLSSQTLPHKSSERVSQANDVYGRKLLISERGKWSCEFCTYLNDSERAICEICGKSRCKGSEAKPLASGGKECPKCTLVNERQASKCDACETSLEDSPTYV